MTQIATGQKTITVSGLYSGIGKTTLSECIVSILPNIAAIKITINDHITAVVDDDATIMAKGKDTCRLKTEGAGKVVWIQSTEENLLTVLPEAISLMEGFTCILFEGNSVVRYLTPDMAIFLCDDRLLCTQALKPSRIEALEKAVVVINNLRSITKNAQADIEHKIRTINKTAPVISLDISNKIETSAYIKALLARHGFI